MKIALVADVFGEQNNGTTITAMRLVENLRARGHQVTVVSPYKSEQEGYVALPKKNWGIFKNYVEKRNGVIFAKPNDRILREVIANVDLVHFLLPFDVCKHGVKIARELHVPFTTAFHCQPENITSHVFLKNSKFANNLIYKIFRGSYYKYTHFIHCPSQFIADQLVMNGYKGELRVISNGVIDVFHPFSSEKPTQLKDKICILFVGRYSKEKRHDLLIEAAAKSKYADKIQLIFAGCGPQQQAIENLAVKLNLANKPIMKLFSKEDLAKTINFCDLYVHPSDIEIEAISCIEAFSCGLVPVISNSKRSATGQFALTEKNLFEVGDSDSLSKAIDYWLDNPQAKAELSAQYVEYGKQFSISSCVDKMEEMMFDSVNYYTEYYKSIQPVGKINFEYPTDPSQHMIVMRHRKDAKPIDENYKFERKSLPYLVYSSALRGLALLGLPTYARFAVNYKIEGRKNLNKVRNSGAILIANHVHPLDAAVICSCAYKLRKVRFVMLKENVDIPIAGKIMKALGGIPLADTYGGMRKFNETIYELLDKKKLVLFFPEAALWPEYTGIRPFHKGGFTYAVKKNVPILPMVFTFTTMKNGKKRVVLNVGEPMYPCGQSAQQMCDNCEQYFVDFTNKFYKEHK